MENNDELLWMGNGGLSSSIRNFLASQTRWRRNLKRFRAVLTRLALFNHFLIFIYLMSTNLFVVLEYCSSEIEELLLMSLLVFGLYSNLQLIRKDSPLYYAIFNLFVAFAISYRIQTIKRITKYDLTDSELDFYNGFHDKLYAIGECVIGLKISVGLCYVTILIGLTTLFVQLCVNNLFGN